MKERCEDCNHRLAQHSVVVYNSGYTRVKCFHNSWLKGKTRYYECKCEDELQEVIGR